MFHSVAHYTTFSTLAYPASLNRSFAYPVGCFNESNTRLVNWVSSVSVRTNANKCFMVVHKNKYDTPTAAAKVGGSGVDVESRCAHVFEDLNLIKAIWR